VYVSMILYVCNKIALMNISSGSPEKTKKNKKKEGGITENGRTRSY